MHPRGALFLFGDKPLRIYSLQILSDRRRRLREQLELLWELQKIDLDLKSIKEEKDRYPKEMKKLDEKQKIEKERIQKEKEKIESLEKTRRQKEGHLNLEQEKIKRAEGRMSEVKTNKEYQALLSEIDAIKEANSRDGRGDPPGLGRNR